MSFNPEQKQSFREVALPLMKWLAENTDPHTSVIVTNRRAELVQGAISFVDETLVND
jgi:hypothetical protein